MTDIVERLRKREFAATVVKDNPAIYRDAADEIERQRDDNQRIRQSIKKFVSNSTRVTNEMLREMYERENGDD